MKEHRLIRGAALPETAIVMTATLAMVFGIIQIGMIGFLQIMVDGAAFIAAHEYALGNSTGYAAKTQLVFPQVTAQNSVIDQNSPDATTVAVNYNSTNTTQRHGGVSLIRATHAQATVNLNAPTGLLGVGIAGLSNIAVHGSAIEPLEQVSSTVYDANGQGYAGNGAMQTAFFANSQLANGDPQNAPANYISQHQMSVCTVWAAGKCTAFLYHALGSAVFLDHDNWNRANLGVGPYSSAYTFGELLCHQQTFVLARQLYFKPARANAQMPSNINVADTTNPVGAINSWDYIGPGKYGPGETKLGLFPLHPGNLC